MCDALRKLEKPIFMMANEAKYSHMNEYSKYSEYDIVKVREETDTDYVGSFVFGLGFFNVKFPKTTTRNLTEEEINQYQKTHVELNGMDLGPVLREKTETTISIDK